MCADDAREQGVGVPSSWWAKFFDATYRRLWAPVLGASRTAWELEGLEVLFESLALPVDQTRILDVCGGDGRVARPLAGMGAEVHVLDRSADMLVHGRGLVGGDDVASWVCADARVLPVAEGAFDVALNLYTSFGFFATDAEHVAMLQAIARCLRPGGWLILDTQHRDFMMAAHRATQTWYTLDDGSAVRMAYDFDPVSGRTHEALYTGDGVEPVKRWSLRLFTATELSKMLEAAGLEAQAWLGGYDLEPFQAESPRVLVVAQRPREDGVVRGAGGLWRCPATGQRLRRLDEEALEGLAGRRHGVLEEAWVRQDGRVAYPMGDGVLHLHVDAAMPV